MCFHELLASGLVRHRIPPIIINTGDKKGTGKPNIYIINTNDDQLDTIAKITYHPASPQNNKFWLVTHILFYIGAAVVLVYFWIPYWIGMGVSVMVDIYDWGFIRGVRYFRKDPDWLESYRIHPLIDKIRERFFFFAT